MNNQNISWVIHYGNWLIRWRWLVLCIALISGLLIAAGMQFLTFNNEYRVFFSEDNPQLQAFEKMQKTYTKIDNILVAIEDKNGDGFSANNLALVEEFTEKAWLLPYVLRVDSLSNYQYSHSEGDDLIVEDLYQNASQLSPTERKALLQKAKSEPAIYQQLLNHNGSVIGINITFQMPQKDPQEAPIAVAEIRKIITELEQKYDAKIYASGVVMLSNAFFEAAMDDMGTLVPIMYGVIILVAWLLVRSKSATFATVVIIVMAMLSAMGMAGFFGIQLTPPSTGATTIIMTIAVADSVHILVSMFSAMRDGKSRHDAIVESLRVNFSPVALTSLTTAIGFLSMNFSDSPPFHDLGNITAMGVIFAWIFSITLLPALMAIMPAKAHQKNQYFDKKMNQLAEFVIKKNKLLLSLSIVISVITLSTISHNKIEDNFLKYFDNSFEFRNDSDYITQNLTGLFQIQYSLESGESNGVADPAFLQKVDSFTEWLRAQPKVMHVSAISDTFKRLNKNMHGDSQTHYRLPESKAMAAQYLLLYELSLPYGLDLNNQLNIDKSATQVIVTVEDMPNSELRAFADSASQWLASEHGLNAPGIGPAVMFSYIADRNIKSMIVGTLVALVLISALIMVAIKDVKLGLLSLIPNLLPAAVAFGIWGMVNGEVNMAVAMVTGLLMGIVVDDTVHFLTKYVRARKEKSMSVEDAIRYTFSSVGVAILTTSVVLSAGFIVLAQSSFGMNNSMAALTAIGIMVALIADLLLLPPLLMKLDKTPKVVQQNDSSKEQVYAS